MAIAEPQVPFSTVPEGAETGPAAWLGSDMATRDDWIYALDASALAEFDAALDGLPKAGLNAPDFAADAFPLPTLSGRLAQIRRTLESGAGLALLRGIDAQRYDEAALRNLLWGLGCHLGTALPQSAEGEIIGVVRDEVRALGDVYQPWTKPRDGDDPLTSRAKARSNGPLRFHSDRCDILALLCARQAQAGGVNRLVSSVAVYNTIHQRRPDLAQLLTADYPRSREGEEIGGEDLVYHMPVFATWHGHFTSHYSRTYVEAAARLPRIPDLTAAQDEALDMLADVALELSFEYRLQPGELLLLNNHVLYHARSAYEDGNTGDDRLLLRLWLAHPDSRPLPPGFDVLWGDCRAGQVRGGIRHT
jgi:hypothetical protein